jgi:hypothetical protein
MPGIAVQVVVVAAVRLVGGFASRCDVIMRAIEAMMTTLGKERRYYEQRWTEWERHIEAVAASLYGIAGDLVGLGAEVPPLLRAELPPVSVPALRGNRPPIQVAASKGGEPGGLVPPGSGGSHGAMSVAWQPAAAIDRPVHAPGTVGLLG